MQWLINIFRRHFCVYSEETLSFCLISHSIAFRVLVCRPYPWWAMRQGGNLVWKLVKTQIKMENKSKKGTEFVRFIAILNHTIRSHYRQEELFASSFRSLWSHHRYFIILFPVQTLRCSPSMVPRRVRLVFSFLLSFSPNEKKSFALVTFFCVLRPGTSGWASEREREREREERERI